MHEGKKIESSNDFLPQSKIKTIKLCRNNIEISFRGKFITNDIY